MTRFLVCALAIPLLCVACSGGTTTGPTPPTAGFLSGRWTGSITIVRAGLPDAIAATEWVFRQVPNGGGSGYTATAVIHDGWLPVTVDVKTIVIPPEPGGTVGSTGFYASPRGCTGVLGSDGMATATRITGTIDGVDCPRFPSTAVFSGTISLTKER